MFINPKNHRDTSWRFGLAFNNHSTLVFSMCFKSCIVVKSFNGTCARLHIYIFIYLLVLWDDKSWQCPLNMVITRVFGALYFIYEVVIFLCFSFQHFFYVDMFYCILLCAFVACTLCSLCLLLELITCW
jgi:hypothetical protein